MLEDNSFLIYINESRIDISYLQMNPKVECMSQYQMYQPRDRQDGLAYLDVGARNQVILVVNE
jgi:hypothetical protein